MCPRGTKRNKIYNVKVLLKLSERIKQENFDENPNNRTIRCQKQPSNPCHKINRSISKIVKQLDFAQFYSVSDISPSSCFLYVFVWFLASRQSLRIVKYQIHCLAWLTIHPKPSPVLPAGAYSNPIHSL